MKYINIKKRMIPTIYAYKNKKTDSGNEKYICLEEKTGRRERGMNSDSGGGINIGINIGIKNIHSK
jgi:hypothetical protein